MRVLPFGDRALLAEYGSLDETMAAYRALARDRPAGVLELVPAARTVLARIDPAVLSLRAVEQWLETTTPLDAEAAQGPLVSIPVRYDGPDLAETADLLGLSPTELVSRHSLAEWTCAFIGFAPGFAYLAGGSLEVPRRATSRESVPAGSVGLAGEFSGVYPRSSPGGWRLIASTDAVLWNETREPPALLAPGTRVRFEVVEP